MSIPSAPASALSTTSRCSRRTGRTAKNGEGPLSGPSLRSKLRHCSRISEDSFHCMQVDTGSRSGETAGWFHPGYSDCFMTARLLKSLLKKDARNLTLTIVE